VSGAIPRVDPEKTANSELKRRVTAFALTKAGTWYSSRVGARIDPWLVRMTRGRVDSTFGVIPVVVVTVRGARSGVERKVPLLYFSDGDDVILIASSYGKAKFPAWYYNITANPEVHLEAMGRAGSYIAHETDGEDHDRLFELAKLVYSGYSQYQQRTSGIRRIPVMRLSPA
jgi:deazaflavin-dependent oxidoreductase (nitroreductase family)